MRRRSPVTPSTDHMEKGTNKSQQSRLCVLGLLCAFFWGFLLYFHFVIIGGRSFQVNPISSESRTLEPIPVSRPIPEIDIDHVENYDKSESRDLVVAQLKTPKPEPVIEPKTDDLDKPEVFHSVTPQPKIPQPDPVIEQKNDDLNKPKVFPFCEGIENHGKQK